MAFDPSKHPREGSGRFTHRQHEESGLSLPEVTGQADFADLLESSASLQRLVPGAVLVGRTAAALHAGHRLSLDHDHVVEDLRARYDQVLDAVEASDGWATDPNASSDPNTIRGSLDRHQAGLRQLRRSRLLETAQARMPSGQELLVPTADEMLRIKGYLVVRRNAVRDYLDVAALAEKAGTEHAGAVLRGIDDYYTERTGTYGSVATALTRRLASPRPKDLKSAGNLSAFLSLGPRWASWDAVVDQCQQVAVDMLGEETEG